MQSTTALAPLDLFPIRQEDYRRILRQDLDILQRVMKVSVSGEHFLVCSRCSRPLRVSTVAHPIWDGPFDGAGSGSCDYREIPYCFFCDGEYPEFCSGAPIRALWFPGAGRPYMMKRLWERISRNRSAFFWALFSSGTPPR